MTLALEVTNKLNPSSASIANPPCFAPQPILSIDHATWERMILNSRIPPCTLFARVSRSACSVLIFYIR